MNKKHTSEEGTVREYLDWVKEIKKESESNQLFDCTTLFFRGQSNHSWPIQPCVFRVDKGIYCEYFLYKRAQALAWDVLCDCHSPLEILVRLQHFGLPTRLLDVTHNPLVALFFACDGNPKNNGCVYWGSTEKLEDNGFADTIAKGVIRPFNGGYNCKNIRKLFPEMFSNVELWSESDGIKLEYCVKGLSRPYYFLPPYNNSRIKAQKGAFIIPPLICTNGINNPDENTLYVEPRRDIDYRTATYRINETETKVFQPNAFIVNASHKKKILTELEEINIDRATLFPDNVEALMNYIADSVRMKIVDSE